MRRPSRRFGPRAPGGLLWSPLSLGSKFKMWFDASSPWITLSGGKVATWTCRISGYAITQGVAGARPVIASINGKDFVDFDGSDDELNGGATAISTILGTPGQLELWAVAQLDTLVSTAASTDGAPFFKSAGAVRYGLSARDANVQLWLLNAAEAAYLSAVSGAAPATGSVLRIRGSTDNTTTVRNKTGAQDEATAAGGAQSANQFANALIVGYDSTNARYLDGAIRHLMVFTTELTSAERSLLDGWLVRDCGAAV